MSAAAASVRSSASQTDRGVTSVMPAKGQGWSGSGRARFPAARAAIGEDPARYLDCDLVSKPMGRLVSDVDERGFDIMRLVPDDDVSSEREFVRARIRGIDRIEVIEWWIRVEHELDRGPRKKVIEWLRERYVQLEEIGERPDRLSYRGDRDGL